MERCQVCFNLEQYCICEAVLLAAWEMDLDPGVRRAWEAQVSPIPPWASEIMSRLFGQRPVANRPWTEGYE